MKSALSSQHSWSAVLQVIMATLRWINSYRNVQFILDILNFLTEFALIYNIKLNYNGMNIERCELKSTKWNESFDKIILQANFQWLLVLTLSEQTGIQNFKTLFKRVQKSLWRISVTFKDCQLKAITNSSNLAYI